MHAVYSLL
ncbi:hypothetical protein RDI58_020559 [Solanum bulbocastanum]|uniref:Uncharacterized protein n=1 Tax=Solanum bulbocastanum TaxID=147425 RepID=A0AAN8T6I4_SOLBU